MLEFTAELRQEPGHSVLFIEFPFDVKALFGTTANIKVKVTYDGIPHRGWLTNMGLPHHFLGLKRELRDKIGKKAGDLVHVTLELDLEERTVDVPADVTALLAQHPDLAAFFHQLAYSHRKEYVQWIEDAKKPETRQRRLGQLLEKLQAKIDAKKPN